MHIVCGMLHKKLEGRMEELDSCMTNTVRVQGHPIVPQQLMPHAWPCLAAAAPLLHGYYGACARAFQRGTYSNCWIRPID